MSSAADAFVIARSSAPRNTRNAINASLCGIIGLPLVLLWIMPHALLGGDWSRSLWITAYVSDYLRIYHHPPNVFHSSASLGIAYPVFYGVLLYRLAGFISVFTDPSIGLRVLISALFIFQTLTVYRAARVLQAARGIALLFCIGTSLSTYGLTNLYNRGDVAEESGLLLLGTALAAWFWSLGSLDHLERWFSRTLIAASLSFLGGTHVVTLVLGAAAFFVISGIALCVDRRRTTIVTLAVAIAGCAGGALIFVTEFGAIGPALRLAPGFVSAALSVFPDRIDTPLARFAPFPIDPQSVLQGLDGVSTPYLEAPIDYALLLFAVAALISRRDRLAALFVALAVGLGFVSVWPWLLANGVGPLRIAGSAYRLTAYVNLFSSAAAFTVLWRLSAQSRRLTRTSLPWIAGTIAVVACVIKLNHGYAVITPQSELALRTSITDGSVMAAVDTAFSTIPANGQKAPPHAPPPAIVMSQTGTPEPQHYVADRDGIIFTRILLLPWNNVIVDGTVIADARKLSWPDYPYYGLRLRPYSSHTIETSFSLPPPVDRAIRVAEYTFLLELLGLASLSILVLRRHGLHRAANQR